MEGRTGADSDFVDIHINDVNYIKMWRRTKNSDRVLAYFTSSGAYLGLSTLIDAYALYKPFGFELIGRSVIVNQRLVEGVDVIESNGSLVTFKDGSSVKVRKQI
jgi:hypothetical protein